MIEDVPLRADRNPPLSFGTSSSPGQLIQKLTNLLNNFVSQMRIRAWETWTPFQSLHVNAEPYSVPFYLNAYMLVSFLTRV